MIEVNGKHNIAHCYCDELESKAEEQIRTLCDQTSFADSKIRIMPDVHAGMGCTIGTTMTVDDKVVPGMVGVDIGCGMETVSIAEKAIDLKKLDNVIHRQIPCGRNIRKTPYGLNGEMNLEKLRCGEQMNLERARKSIGTLGGGNHFIEVDRGRNGQLYVVVHSGSRHLGNELAKYYQKQACKALQDTDVPRDLCYVEGLAFADYIHEMKIVQRYAVFNRKAMMDIILDEMNLTALEEFTTIHNYIDTETMVLRKGAVSAKKGEKLLIPINMRDGSLICIGRGNKDWNMSAPHGAGRLMSRRNAMKTLSLEGFREEMKGIYTTCVKKATLDEAPMAYKSLDMILDQIQPTVEVVDHIKPIYNFKAAE